MATKNTDKTIWAVVLIAVFLFMLYKAWPAIKNALNKLGGGSGSSGSVGGATDDLPPYNNGQGGGGQGSGGGFGANAGGSLNGANMTPNGSQGGAIPAAVRQFLQATGLIDQSDVAGTPNALLSSDDASAYSDLGNTLSIPYQAIQLFTDFPTETPQQEEADEDSTASDTVSTIYDGAGQISDDSSGSDVSDYDSSSSDDSDDSDDGGGDDDDADDDYNPDDTDGYDSGDDDDD